MGRAIVPVSQLSRRLPDAGRIRIGVRAGKAMKAIDTFRFTSQDRVALEQVAEIYGGTVKPWSDPKAAKGQYEVITEASEIRIALPPDPLGGTPIYEHWTGGGCARRCDGETCEMLVAGPEGPEPQQTPCPCFIEGSLTCKLITRLSVLLPEIRFVGVWRIDTKSWNAAQELPGMVDLIRSLQDRGITRGVLQLVERRSVTAGETHIYKVPILGVDQSIEALAAGTASMGSLGSVPAPVAELGVGSEEVESRAEAPSSEPHDDEIIDAELVEPDDDTLAVLHRAADTSPKKNRALRAAREAAESKGISLPIAFEEITEPVLVAAAVDALVGA